MTLLSELTCPPMSATACFHGNQCWTPIGEKAQHLAMTQLDPFNFTCFAIDGMDLKHVLRNIHPNHVMLHCGSSYQVV